MAFPHYFQLEFARTNILEYAFLYMQPFWGFLYILNPAQPLVLGFQCALETDKGPLSPTPCIIRAHHASLFNSSFACTVECYVC